MPEAGRAGYFFGALIFLIATGIILGMIDNTQITACHATDTHAGTNTITQSNNMSFLGMEIPMTGFIGSIFTFTMNLFNNLGCFITYAWWLFALVYIPVLVMLIYGLVGIVAGGG